MNEIYQIIKQINEEVNTNKSIEFSEALNNLFLMSPVISFLKCFKKNVNNNINAFNFDTLPKEYLNQCFKEVENVNVRTLYFNKVGDCNNIKNLQNITMKDVFNQFKNFIDDKDLFNYLMNTFENKSAKEILTIYFNNIDNQEEKKRIEKFTKIVTEETNDKDKLELEAKDLYLLSLYIEKQTNIKCKGIFIVNFLLESYIRGNNDAFYKLCDYADLLNKNLSEYNTNLEEEWLLKLMAQHVLAVIYSCKIRLLKLNDKKAKALFQNVYILYNELT